MQVTQYCNTLLLKVTFPNTAICVKKHSLDILLANSSS